MGKLLLLFVLFNLSAFFSGSETAFFSIDELSASRIGDEHLVDRLVRRLLEKKERLLTTVLLGNEVVNVAISSLSASIFMDVFGEKWIGASVFVTTIFLLLYGELLPKVMAVKYNKIWAAFAAPFLFLISFLLAPVRVLLEGMARMVSALVGREDVGIGEDDFKAIVDEARKRGMLDDKERVMIYSVFRFSDLQAKDVMVPEPDIFMVDVNTPWDRLEEMIKENRFSKIPVYEGNRDNVIGYIKLTDVLPVFRGLMRSNLRDMVRPCEFIPETKPVQELLREFQVKRIDMALVVNEYGAIEGLVTLEDIIEELVGEIWDEHDRERVMVKKEGDAYIVNALYPLDKLCDVLDIELDENPEVDTTGGFVMHLLGRIPSVGESVSYKGWRFTVLDAAKRRIKAVRVEKDEVSGDQR